MERWRDRSVLLRDEVDRTEVLPVALEYPSHRKNPFSRGSIGHDVPRQSHSSKNTFILDETQGPEKVHWCVSDGDDTEADAFQQRLPFSSSKWASTDMDDRRQRAADFALPLRRHVAGDDREFVNAIPATGTKQPECLGRDQALVLGSLHAQHGFADD